MATRNRLIEMAGSRFDPALLVAIIHASLGEVDVAFEWVEQAIERGASPIYLLRLMSAFTGLQHDPRYRSCLLRVGLPPYPTRVVVAP